MNKAFELKAAISAALAALTAFWGWFGWLTLLWIGCMALDFASGVIAACRNGGWKSKIARDGIYHKGGMVLTVGVAAAADLLIGLMVNNIPAIPLPFDYGVLITPMVMVWYIITELGSIAENVGKMGGRVPPWLLKCLASLQDATDAAGELLDTKKDGDSNG